MTEYETRLRGARNRIAAALGLTTNAEAKTKLATIFALLDQLIVAEAPKQTTEDLIS